MDNKLVEAVARAICWAFSEETDDCASTCLNARRCKAEQVDDSFKRDARAAIVAYEAATPLASLQTENEALRDALGRIDKTAAEASSYDAMVALGEIFKITRAALPKQGG